jgi:putative transposon-encoded protein
MKGNIVIEFQAEEIIDGRVTRFGNGAHVLVPKAWTGSKVKIIRLKEENK